MDIPNFISTRKVHLFLVALLTSFFISDKASACSMEEWPCFETRDTSNLSKAKSSKRLRYYQRIARLKQAASRKHSRATIGKVRGKSIANKGKYLPILRRVKPRGLPIKLAAAVVTVESGWRAEVIGSVGEVGLMQLRPATAQWFGSRAIKRAKKAEVSKKLHSPELNLRIGTRYLYWCYKRAKRDVAATIGCYNRGPGRMWSWKENKITSRYVSKVRRLIRRGRL